MGLPVDHLDGLEGSWHLEGTVLGKPLAQEVVVEWMLYGGSGHIWNLGAGGSVQRT